MSDYFNMAKQKYYYDKKTLSYKKINRGFLNRIKQLFFFLIGSAFVGFVMIIIFFQFFDSPKEKILKRYTRFMETLDKNDKEDWSQNRPLGDS